MTQNNDKNRNELQRVLDTYGGDRARWPAEVRADLERLLETDAAGRRLLAEERALERVLAKAPLPRAGRVSELSDRILAAAAAMPAPDAQARTGSNVVALPARRPAPDKDDVLTKRTAWQAAGLIAACLLAGIYMGEGSNVLPLMQDVAESVGIIADLDPNSSGLGDLDGEDSL